MPVADCQNRLPFVEGLLVRLEKPALGLSVNVNLVGRTMQPLVEIVSPGLKSLAPGQTAVARSDSA